MNVLARDAGAVVVYPEQTQNANSQNCWNWFKTQHQRRGRGEPELLVSLVKAVVAEQDIDPAQVYLAGLSSGGAMAAILARAYPDVFAAVGIHSGVPAGVAQDLTSGLDVMRHGVPSGINAAGAPIPLIVFQGEADEVVHRDNARALVESACKALGITEAPEVHSGRGANFRSFRRSSYRLADSVALVEHWQLTGGGHAWSGGHAAASYTSPGGPSASAEMLRFFRAHRSGQARH
jgi:poly(hydroxyalkanoate) depolymerase family esterase